MKKIAAFMVAAMFISFVGCSSSDNGTSSQATSSINSGAESSGIQSSAQTSSSVNSNSVSSSQSMIQDPPTMGSKESPANTIDVNHEGSQIDITGSNTPDIPNADCLEPYRIGFNIRNVSDKPITKILIRETDSGGCAVDVDESLNQLPLNKTYRGTEWDYTGSIGSQEIGFCDLYVIPKQLSYQTLVFQFFMADGETPFRNANNNPAIVKVRFGINGGDPIPTSEPFKAEDIDIGGKLVYSQDDQSHFVVFNVQNTAYFSELNGIMFRIPEKDYAGYELKAIPGGSVDIENGYYVWRFSQALARRSEENITISCPSDKPPQSGFDFYTLDGKTKICTCTVTSG